MNDTAVTVDFNFFSAMNDIDSTLCLSRLDFSYHCVTEMMTGNK